MDTKETITLLSELIQNKCVNPPGNELKSIHTIQRFLQERNIETQIFESAPSRGNLVARISGRDQGPKLMFGPSHVDVVPVGDLDLWEVDPFSGIVKDGYVWGRGAMDMLFIVATQVQAFSKLHKEDFKPNGDIILFIVCDEEKGGVFGTDWMWKNYPKAIQADYAVSEHGGLFVAPGKAVFMIGEKGTVQKRITFHGTSGHGAMPFGVDNTLVKASIAVQRLSKFNAPITTVYLNYLAEGLGLSSFKRFMISNKSLLGYALNKMKVSDPTLARVAHGLSRMTISPNIVHVDEAKINVIPSKVDVDVDIRPLPGQDEAYILNQLKRALGSLAHEASIKSLEYEEGGFESYGNESPTRSPFVSAMEQAVQQVIPNSTLVPFIYPPASDLRFMRKQGAASYGFSLFDPETPVSHLVDLSHGENERVSIKTLEMSQKAYYNLAKIFLSSPEH